MALQKKILIVGNAGVGMTASTAALIQKLGDDYSVVTAEDAKQLLTLEDFAAKEIERSTQKLNELVKAMAEVPSLPMTPKSGQEMRRERRKKARKK